MTWIAVRATCSKRACLAEWLPVSCLAPKLKGGDGDRDGVEVEWFRSGGTTRDRNATSIGYL